jgi:alpha-galactosidase
MLMTGETHITFRAGDRPGARYLTGRVAFDEQFGDGRLCARYWSAAGQVWPEMHIESIRYAPDQPADTFLLAIDGQRLEGGYEWIGADSAPGQPAAGGAGQAAQEAVVALRHPARGIEVKVHTRLDGGPFVVRWLEIANRSDRAAAITAVAPFSGLLWSQRANEHPRPEGGSPFEIAYTHQFAWGQEGDFWFEPLPDGVKIVDGGKLGRSGWGRPAFWARNRFSGQTFVCELAWGGNYRYALDCRLRDGRDGHLRPVSSRADLYFQMGLSGHDAALRVLAPGETVATPAVHLGLFHADTDAIVQATHAHVRHAVMPARVPGRTVEIEANHRGYWCDRETEPGLKGDAEVARAIGAELYVIDAGWYGNDPNRWGDNVGDWRAGSWLPNGLEPVADHAHALGMGFGLWVEIEAAGANSTLRKAHPDWLLTRDGQPVAGGRALDLTRPEVAAWVESEIDRLIRQYRLDMYRIDHNHTLSPSGNRAVEGVTEDLTWRYYDALYGIFDRLRARHPGVVFQNCAGGGGRLDWGTLARFNNSELSDWMRLPRGLRILNGVTMSLPPEILLRTFGTEVPEIDLDGDVDAQLRLVCLCRPIFRGIAPSVGELSAFLKARIDHHLDLYRGFIRPVMIDGRVFHHTPFLPLTQSTPWCALEYAAPDGSRAVAGVFRTGDEDTLRFRPRGLDVSRAYDVTLDNRGQTFRAPGRELADGGVLIRLDAPLASELLLFQAA